MESVEVDSDEALLGPLRAGDESAFVVLVERHHAGLVRLARTFVRPEAAEDVAQDTWAAVLRGIHGFEGRSSLRTWLFGICANRARSTAARERRLLPYDPGRTDDLPQSWAAEPDWSRSCDVERATSDEVEPSMTQIRAAIAGLPPAQREVVSMRDLEGASAAQTCRRLSITEGNQRVLLHRGRTGVRRILGEAADPDGGSGRRSA
jgi:RNA polymerase sigma-70 factor, ECF subfamily